jgi:hypothetical protein
MSFPIFITICSEDREVSRSVIRALEDRFVSEDMPAHFVRGFGDGDLGSRYQIYTSISGSSAEEAVKDIVAILRVNGVRTRVVEIVSLDEATNVAWTQHDGIAWDRYSAVEEEEEEV